MRASVDPAVGRGVVSVEVEGRGVVSVEVEGCKKEYKKVSF